MPKVDVIRFGVTYCAQHVACMPIVEAVIAEARARRFRTTGGALSYVTRRLREEGLVVATPCDAPRRRNSPPAHYMGGGSAA